MSASLHPRIPEFSDADYLDDDSYGLDCRTNMARRGTTIGAVSLVAVTRQDGAEMDDDDLEVSTVALVPADTVVVLSSGACVTVSAGTFFSWKASGGIAGSSYFVKFALTLASGDTINRTVIINVPPRVG